VLLSQLLTDDRIRVPLSSRDKPSVLKELVDLLARQTGGDAADMLHAVREREATQSTGFGYGIAIPHGRTPTLPSLAMAAGRTAAPIDYGAVDGEPVRLLFLVVGPETAAGDQVRALARIARLLRRDQVRERLLAADSAEAFGRIVREVEAG